MSRNLSKLKISIFWCLNNLFRIYSILEKMTKDLRLKVGNRQVQVMIFCILVCVSIRWGLVRSIPQVSSHRKELTRAVIVKKVMRINGFLLDINLWMLLQKNKLILQNLVIPLKNWGWQEVAVKMKHFPVWSLQNVSAKIRMELVQVTIF